MRFHRRPRVNRAAAEALLGGGGPAPVSGLLAAAAAPGMAHELTGEQAALAELGAAQRHAVPRSRTLALRRRLATVSLANLLTGAAVVTAASGGVALAAVTGVLPTPPHPSAHSASAGAASTSVSGNGPQEDGPGARSHGATSAAVSDGSSPGGRPAPTATSNRTPGPSLTGLCRAYQAGAGSRDGTALDNPAFTVLLTAAGGRDNVADYCFTLVGPAPAGPSTAPRSGPPAHPSGPAAHRPRPPVAHPTGPPTTHPSGPPTAQPAPPAHSPHR
jgi:hypothetical protein